MAAVPPEAVTLMGHAPAGEGERSTPDSRISTAWWMGGLVVLDLAAALAAAIVALILRFGDAPGSYRGLSYAVTAAALPPLWVSTMAAAGAYQGCILMSTAEELRRLCLGALSLLGLAAITSFALRADFSRTLILTSLLLSTMFSIAGRTVARAMLHRRLRAGRVVRRVLIVGPGEEVADLAAELRAAPLHGFEAVGACLPPQERAPSVPGGLTVVAETDDLFAAARAVEADAIALLGPVSIEDRRVRRVSWGLHGSGISLLSTTDGAAATEGHRQLCQVAGTRLVHVHEPRLLGPRRFLKSGFDLLVTAPLVVLTLPLVLALAVAIRLTSSGPVLFMQERVGENGRSFRIWKFRTMLSGADQNHDELLRESGRSPILFKLADDPRVTPLGRWLRRYSLDELPQLWNVLVGDMSLVGPRPQRPCEVLGYSAEARLRLRVKPGMTGAWQVSGRSRLSWDQAIELDLAYIEGWSPRLDARILWRTIMAVLRADGAC